MYQNDYLFPKNTAEETPSVTTRLRDIIHEDEYAQEYAKHDLFLQKLASETNGDKKKYKKLKKKCKKHKKALKKAKSKIERLEFELRQRKSFNLYPFNISSIPLCIDAQRNGGAYNEK